MLRKQIKILVYNLWFGASGKVVQNNDKYTTDSVLSQS